MGLRLGSLFCSIDSSQPISHCLHYYSWIVKTLVSDGVIFPTLFIFVKIILATLGSVLFYINLRISLPIGYIKIAGILIGNALSL